MSPDVSIAALAGWPGIETSTSHQGEAKSNLHTLLGPVRFSIGRNGSRSSDEGVRQKVRAKLRTDSSGQFAESQGAGGHQEEDKGFHDDQMSKKIFQ